MSHTCTWILKPNAVLADGSFQAAEYCGEKVRYTIKTDDDGNKVRKYDHLCPKHRERADAEGDED